MYQARDEFCIVPIQPFASLNETINSELSSFILVSQDPETLPFDPLIGGGSRTGIAILNKLQGVKVQISIPWQPPIWVNGICNFLFHDDCTWELLPGPAQVWQDAGLIRE